MVSKRIKLSLAMLGIVGLLCQQAVAQEQLPHDTGLSSYHSSPAYRSSESHPLRVLSYILNPIGWVAREGIFRPLSHFASSTETRRSVMGYRDPFDYRRPECFSADDGVPDCHKVIPYNYDNVGGPADEVSSWGEPQRFVYFPDVNFDYDKANLSSLGQGRVHQIADLLKKEQDLTVVLEGHTDFKGSDKYNEALGKKRAETVRLALLDLGVEPSRVSTLTFGESDPELADEADWARAVNRRVEVRTE